MQTDRQVVDRHGEPNFATLGLARYAGNGRLSCAKLLVPRQIRALKAKNRGTRLARLGRGMGDERRSLVAEVPSVIVLDESNVFIIAHAFSRLKDPRAAALS